MPFPFEQLALSLVIPSDRESRATKALVLLWIPDRSLYERRE
jgi:hypothetical protein